MCKVHDHVRWAIAQTLAVMTMALANASLVDATEPTQQDLADAIQWLELQSHDMIQECRREMHDGVAAFPPQVGSGYEAFWLRDYAYMLEGCSDAFTEKELRDACLLFVRAQRNDGACVDCVKFDGTPIYQPGYGSMGQNPVTDGSQFTVNVAWLTYQRLRDPRLLMQIIDPLVRALQAIPRNPATGLVHIRPDLVWDRCPYGFTDTVRKQGDLLFSSLLLVQADRRLADLLDTVGRQASAVEYRRDADRLAAQLRSVCWDDSIGLFRAATIRCKEPDIWGSAFAVYLKVATREQTERIAGYFKTHYDEIVQRGQIRHLPGGVYWEQAGPRDQYQNGAFWSTATGWFVCTLDTADPALADQTMIDLVNDFRQRGIVEWCYGDAIRLPGYVASGANPLAGVRAMLERRGNTRPHEP